MTRRLAFSTITLLSNPYGHPDILSFEDRIGPVFEAAEQSPGFITRARPVDDKLHLTNFERDWGIWGTFTVPRFYRGGQVTTTDSRASTLSIWVDLESVKSFAFRNSQHKYMLQNKKRWVPPFEWKNYAAWWVEPDEIPSWSEACARIEYINDHGPSAHAFDFGHPYDQEGRALAKPRDRDPHAVATTPGAD